MTFRRAATALLVLALVGSACSKKTDEGTGSGEGKAATYTVQVDSHKQGGDYGTYASAYFPSEVKVHPGDTVSFKLNWSGEPHSVTFGTLVDEGAGKLDPNAEDEPEAWQKIPSMLPQGPGDANQTVVNPCYLESGTPPENKACEQQTQPAFTGKQALYNSGFLADGSNFAVKFDAAIAPATYNFFCVLHRGIMMGKVTVVAAAVEVPAPAEVLKQGDDGVAEIATKLKASFDKSKDGMGPGAIFAGTTDPGFFEAQPPLDAGVTEFMPKTPTAKVGEKVKFVPVGAHTVTINPPQDAVEFIVKGPDGAYHLNEKAAAPAQSPPTGEPGEKPVVTDAGTWNGEGFLNSGVLLGFGPPGAITWQITFGKAGTYAFRCLIHPDMEGSITVS